MTFPTTFPEETPRIVIRKAVRGLLIIGDPHLTCERPGRRTDENFLQTGLSKLQRAREIARERGLFMLFPGDLFDNASAKRQNTNRVAEDTNLLLTGYAIAMDGEEAAGIPGNHDTKEGKRGTGREPEFHRGVFGTNAQIEARVTPGTTLYTCKILGLLTVVEDSGPFAIFEIEGKKVGVGGTPYGGQIPRDVRGVFGEPVDCVVWMTHGNFVFDDPYPSAIEPFEIKGCDVVVNGHDHTTQKPKQIGQTLWFNPGNILRMSVDCAEHEPSVWEWTPSGGFARHALPHQKNVFDLTGMRVAPDVKGIEDAAIEHDPSLFASLLAKEEGADIDRTDSGDVLAEDIERVLAGIDVPDAVRYIVRELHRRAPERSKPAV